MTIAERSTPTTWLVGAGVVGPFPDYKNVPFERLMKNSLLGSSLASFVVFFDFANEEKVRYTTTDSLREIEK